MDDEGPRPDPPHLFVYGTLRPGGRAPPHLRSLLETRGRRIGAGTVRGRLHDAGAYPVAVGTSVPEEEDGPRIRGVVYGLDAPDEVLAAVDDYEGVRPDGAGLFRRDVTDVRLDAGRSVRAWIYWYDREAGHLPEIPGGDWRRVGHRGERGPET